MEFDGWLKEKLTHLRVTREYKFAKKTKNILGIGLTNIERKDWPFRVRDRKKKVERKN